MGIEHINRVGWIVIGAIVGALVGLAISSSGQNVEGIATTDLQTFEREGQEKPVCVAESLVMYFGS